MNKARKEIVVADGLDPKTLEGRLDFRLIALRALTQKETRLARAHGLKRYFLPTLSQTDTEGFFAEFDRFWQKIVQSFPPDHAFWRNAVSSKMQEGERSASYLALILFTLSTLKETDTLKIIILCGSLQEEEIIRDWAGRYRWSVFPMRMPRRVFRGFLQELKNFMMFIRMVFIGCYHKYFSPSSLSGLEEHAGKENAALIVSLFYPASFKKGSYQDPFFGPLHRTMNEQGMRCLYLNSYLVHPNRQTKKSMSLCHEVKVLTPFPILSWGQLMEVFLRVFFRRLKIPQSRFLSCDLSRLLRWNSRRFTDHFHLISEIFFEAISHLCLKLRFKSLVCIFEGNSFERGCIQAFRRCSKGDILGYSQGVIYRSNLKLYLTPEEYPYRPEPDRYICTGPYAKSLLSRIGSRPGDRIMPGCSLRQMPEAIQYLPSIENLKKSSSVLLALDGFSSSAAVLDWMFEHAKILESFKVYVRAHPNVPLKKLLAHCLLPMPSNYQSSHNDLEEDLAGCFCVLYRHTSIGMQALLRGIPAIHLAIDSPLAADPLEELQSAKWTVTTPEALQDAILKIRNLNQAEYEKEWIKAKEFIQNYLSQPTPEAMKDFFVDK